MAFEKSWGLLVCIVVLASCQERVQKTIVVRNSLPFDRNEVVAIKLADISDDTTHRYSVRSGDDVLISQRVDSNNDSAPDELIFLVDIEANKEETIEISLTGDAEETNPEVKAYSRFVPERTD